MDNKLRTEIPATFSAQNVFAILLIRTTSGEVLLRPIGGAWHCGIDDTIKEIVEKYPGCDLKMYGENYSAFREYFEPCGVGFSQVWQDTAQI